MRIRLIHIISLLFLTLFTHDVIGQNPFIRYRISIGMPGLRLGPSYDYHFDRSFIFVPTSFVIEKGISIKYLLGLEYYHCSLKKLASINSWSVGNILSTDFKVVNLRFGLPIRDEHFLIIPSLNLGYRWGQGHQVLMEYTSGLPPTPSTFHTEFSRFSSLSIGANIEMMYFIYKGFSVGLNLNYSYFFESSHLSDNHIELYPNDPLNKIYRDFSPDCKIFRTALTAGYLF